MIINIQETSSSLEVTLNIKNDLQYYANILTDMYCKNFGLEIQDIENLLPAFLTILTKDNWFEATNKKDLESLKISDLKYILSVNNKKVSGNKNDLINRVWDIHHPSYKVIKNSKNKTQDITSVEDSDTDDDISLLEFINSYSEYVYIKNKKLTKDRTRKYKRLFIKEKNWILKEYSDRYEYLGVLKNRRLVKTPMPRELKKYFLNY